MIEPCFLGDVWMLAYPWEAVNDFLLLSCLCTQLLLLTLFFLRNFYTFTLPILFILSGGLARGRGLVGLSYKWGLNHNILWVKRTKQGVEHNLALTTDLQVKQNGFRRTIILWGKNKLPKKSPKNGRLDFCFIQSSF